MEIEEAVTLEVLSLTSAFGLNLCLDLVFPSVEIPGEADPGDHPHPRIFPRCDRGDYHRETTC